MKISVLSIRSRLPSVPSMAAVLGCLLIAQAHAAIIVQAGDPGAAQGNPTPNSNTAALAFDALNTPTFIETFEDGDADFFSFSTGTITSAPVGGGSSLFAFNTTPAGAYVLQLGTSSNQFFFLNPLNSFGFYLTGVQRSTLSVSFNDGASQSFAINNYGSGAQFFGASGLSNPITSFAIINPIINGGADAFGIDDLRFSTSQTSAVPEPPTWGTLVLGIFAIACASGL